MLLVAVAYAQVVRFEFLNYDDTIYVPDNPHVRSGFSPGGIAWAFTTFETANWYPLTWLSLMLDCQIFGPWASGIHAVNAALHAANAVLLFIVLRRMTWTRWRSAAVAALFAVHPLHVESVAWIAERKDVLSTLFFLLTLLAYERYAASPRFSRWLVVFLCMALGLMAKSMLVTLPVVLFLLDFWPLGRVGGRRKVRNEMPKQEEVSTGKSEISDLKSQISNLGSQISSPPLRGPLPGVSTISLIVEKLPLLALSLATAAVTVAAQSSKGATEMLYGRADLPVRLANAAIASVKYIAMTVWPARLAVYYPYDFYPSPWLSVSAAVLLVVLTSVAIVCLIQSSRQTLSAVRRDDPASERDSGLGLTGGRHSESACYYAPLAVGWLWYLITLVPVIGLVQVGSQAMADRYCYIPSIGLFMAFVWAAGELCGRVPHCRTVLAGAGMAILAVLLVATWRQTDYWINSEQLFRHALTITGENPVACENLGDALLHQGKYAAAEVQFREVLAMDPEHFRQTPPELAQALAGQGRIADAIAFVHEAIRKDAERAAAMNNLALFLAPKGHVREAIELLQKAIELAPEQPLARRNLAWIYATCPDRRFRDGPKAVELARRACELSQWEDAKCRQALADAYLETGDVDRAIDELRAAVRLDPSNRTAAEKLESLLRRP